jgi:hypothetical protein
MKMGKYVDYKKICVVDIIKYGLICNKRNETLFIAKKSNSLLLCATTLTPITILIVTHTTHNK